MSVRSLDYVPTGMAEDRAEPAYGTEQLLLGILSLLAADRDERVDGAPARRTELVLADTGFSAREIAHLTGKQYEAVRSSLRRSQMSAKSLAGKIEGGGVNG